MIAWSRRGCSRSGLARLFALSHRSERNKDLPLGASRSSVDRPSPTGRIPRFFVDRPIFASVIAIVTVFTGLLALCNLPITQIGTLFRRR